MKDILIIGLLLIAARNLTDIICTYITYKQRIKTYKDIVEKYDLDVDLPKNFKEWNVFNNKMLEYQKNNDITDYLFYLSSLNVGDNVE